MSTAVESLPQRDLLRSLAIGYKLSGAISSTRVFETAAQAAVACVFKDPAEPPSRLLSRLSEHIFGAVGVAQVAQVREAIAFLSRGVSIVSAEPHKIRLVTNFGRGQGPQGRNWAVNTILREGLRPHTLTPPRTAAPLSVSCMVSEVPDPRYPFLIADVPRTYAPGLEQAQAGEWCDVPRIPLDFIVGVNGFSFHGFAAAWRSLCQ